MCGARGMPVLSWAGNSGIDGTSHCVGATRIELSMVISLIRTAAHGRTLMSVLCLV